MRVFGVHHVLGARVKMVRHGQKIVEILWHLVAQPQAHQGVAGTSKAKTIVLQRKPVEHLPVNIHSVSILVQRRHRSSGVYEEALCAILPVGCESARPKMEPHIPHAYVEQVQKEVMRIR